MKEGEDGDDNGDDEDGGKLGEGIRLRYQSSQSHVQTPLGIRRLLRFFTMLGFSHPRSPYTMFTSVFRGKLVVHHSQNTF